MQADAFAHEQPEIGRHLIVAAAAGMQLFSAAAPIFGSQRRLDESMNIFIGRRFHLVGRVFRENLLKASVDGLSIPPE